MPTLATLLLMLRALVLDRQRLLLENLALRQQVIVLKRSVKRPQLRDGDRIFWILMRKALRDWKGCLLLVHPDTVVRWHRRGWRYYWGRKSRPHVVGRPPIGWRLVYLIKRLSSDNPLWGAPRIQAELALLGHAVAESAQGDPRDVLAAATALGNFEAFAAENRYEVRVLERGPGTLTLATAGGCRLQMAAIDGFPEPVRVAVRAEDIPLASARPEHVSVQNVLAGDVRAPERLGRHVLVHVACGGETFVARATELAAATLGLAPGRAVHLLVKAHSVLVLA